MLMSSSRFSGLAGALLATIAIGSGLGALGAGTANADGPHATPGAVYQATNSAAGNAVQVYSRDAAGALTVADVVPTGGLGSGNSLGSQGAIVRDGRRLLVVNAGDSTVSSFVISRYGLELRDVAASGGVRPVSVTVHGDTVYVLNAGSDSISGLRLDDDGDLRLIANSTLPLSGTGVRAAQIQFGPAGKTLVVTEKATAKLDVYRVGRHGRASGPTVFDSAGAVPFGFDIDHRGHVVVSEAAPGALSSYQLGDNALTVITASLPDTQAAACWVEISRNGRYAFTTNAATASISTYTIEQDGSLTLVAAVAASTSAAPTDIAQSDDGGFLYVRVGSGAVDAFAIGGDGSLTPIGEITGATSIGTSGLAAI
jgi:6-phosphogluconolactonase (cycloisomerase 2 family)